MARRAGAHGNGGALNLVPVDGGKAVRELANGAGGTDSVRLRARPPVHDFRDASALANEAVPTVLVIEAGRTNREALRRAARLIEEAGGTVAGAVLVCTREKEARYAWE